MASDLEKTQFLLIVTLNVFLVSPMKIIAGQVRLHFKLNFYPCASQ